VPQPRLNTDGLSSGNRMSRYLTCIALTLAFGTTHAWHERGHQQVADIAWTRLKPEVRIEIAEVLKAGELSFRPASDSERDVRAAFRGAAVWADWVKVHPESQFEDMVKTWNAKYQPGYDPADTDGEAHRCKRWHYFDLPIRARGAKPGVHGSNALIALTTARYELGVLGREVVKDRKSQCWWFYWVEHVIGDLHQPLHCASSYELEPGGDAGGNLFKLGVPIPDNPDRMMNLHFFWDRGIDNAIALEPDQSSDVEAVTDRWIRDSAPGDEAANDMDISHWIEEGAKMADDFVYTGIVRGGKPSDEYRAKQAKLCKRQAVLAGFRLANEINKSFGS